MDVVSIIMTTYARTALAVRTLTSLKENLTYPALQWIIADDGSEPTHVGALQNVLQGETVIVTNAQRGGVGKSKNIALRTAFQTSPYVLLLEDDWILTKPLDLTVYVSLLRDNPDFGIVRMGYLGALNQITGYYRGNAEYSYWVLQQASDFYVYSGQVSLRHQRYYDAIGWHDGGMTAGQEEDSMCWRYSQANDPPKIIWPGQFACMFNTGYFVNIGLGESLNGVQPE